MKPPTTNHDIVVGVLCKPSTNAMMAATARAIYVASAESRYWTKVNVARRRYPSQTRASHNTPTKIFIGDANIHVGKFPHIHCRAHSALATSKRAMRGTRYLFGLFILSIFPNVKIDKILFITYTHSKKIITIVIINFAQHKFSLLLLLLLFWIRTAAAGLSRASREKLERRRATKLQALGV